MSKDFVRKLLGGDVDVSVNYQGGGIIFVFMPAAPGQT